MTKVRTWAGLDVHATATVACVVDAASGEMSVHRLAGRTSEAAAFCAQLPAPVRVAYEAGPTGFALARTLHTAGVGCVVAAPGKIERPAQDRVKTDRRDAERLVRLLMIGGPVPHSPWAEAVARLRCLRGIDTLSAVGLCAEIGDFARFEHPGQLMSYVGLVPSEHSSGQTRRQGAITKSGSRHARRLLVEAAWHYRRPPRTGTTLQRRQ